MSGSFSVMHLPTGLFLNAGAVLTMDGLVATTPRYDDTSVDESQLFWAGQAGIEWKANALGKSTLYGELYRYSGAPRPRSSSGLTMRSTPREANGRSGTQT